MKPVQHELVRLLHSGLSRNRPQVPVDGECARVRARAHMCHLSIRGARTGALTRARVAAQARAQEQLSTAMAQMVTQGNIEAEEAAKRKAEEKRAADEARGGGGGGRRAGPPRPQCSTRALPPPPPPRRLPPRSG